MNRDILFFRGKQPFCVNTKENKNTKTKKKQKNTKKQRVYGQVRCSPLKNKNQNPQKKHQKKTKQHKNINTRKNNK